MKRRCDLVVTCVYERYAMTVTSKSEVKREYNFTTASGTHGIVVQESDLRR